MLNTKGDCMNSIVSFYLLMILIWENPYYLNGGLNNEPDRLTTSNEVAYLNPPSNGMIKTIARISMCESSQNPKARNKRSSAKGLFQFTDKTWNAYCDGDVFDASDNTRCFLKLYPKHPDWWECK